MKYSYNLPVSSYTRHSQYTPTQYTPTQYTPTYTPTHYTSTKYTPTHYTPTKYTTNYASSLYTPSHKTASSYTPSYSKPPRYSSAASRAPAQAPPPPPAPVALKPVRAVRFPNDIIFQDCIRRGELEQIGRFIRARKIRLDTVFLSGMAAIHEAVLSGNLECVKLLVKYGADVHQRDEDGWTALHMACSDGYPDIARFLLSLGASCEAQNESGEKPSDLIDPDNKDLVKVFQTGCV
ncbi:protein phosphatase 1 regulatory subunit 27 [Osmerus mordax]|uniref:protein phosphatase 1 regulatory subunit 27 n=1 Tax=Osmerus mordax TaxID=8014 RepID=UPI00350FD32C